MVSIHRCGVLLLFLFCLGCGRPQKSNPYSLDLPKEQKPPPSTAIASTTKKIAKTDVEPPPPPLANLEVKQQEEFDKNLGRILDSVKQGAHSYALEKTRDLIAQNSQSPQYLIQLHFLEAEIKKKLSGDRPGLYNEMLEDLKKIRESKIIHGAISEGKSAQALVHEALSRPKPGSAGK